MVCRVEGRNGFVIGYIEWNLFNKEGNLGGKNEYIYIAGIWVHDRFRETGVFRKLIKLINNHPLSKKANYVYWEVARDSFGDKISGGFEGNRKLSKIYNKEYIKNKILSKERFYEKIIS